MLPAASLVISLIARGFFLISTPPETDARSEFEFGGEGYGPRRGGDEPECIDGGVVCEGR